MVNYIIQLVLYQSLFLVLYEVILKQDTHYRWQRYYLLIAPILACILPFVVFPTLSQDINVFTNVELPTVFLQNEIVDAEVTTPLQKEGVNSISVIWISGIFVSIIVSLWRLHSLRLLRNSSKLMDRGGYKLAIVPNTDTAFSFGKTIYLGDQIDEADKKVILEHEKVHVYQNHSIDLLIKEVLQIALWWNPLVYLFKNRLSAVHEFIADDEVVQHVAKTDYYQNLLSQVFKSSGISFTNTFYKQSLIKKRILMLQKTKSTRKTKFKYLMILPLFAGMLFFASCVNKQTKTDEASKTPVYDEFIEDVKETKKVEVEKIPFSIIENAPVYPGCEDLANNEEAKDCMNSKIQDLVAGNFNTALGKELGLEGLQQIMVIFTINTTGEVSDIVARAKHPGLEEEAKRVLSLLPKMIPGEQRGVKVPVQYTLPIRFEV